jgi:hypothetical protein
MGLFATRSQQLTQGPHRLEHRSRLTLRFACPAPGRLFHPAGQPITVHPTLRGCYAPLGRQSTENPPRSPHPQHPARLVVGRLDALERLRVAADVGVVLLGQFAVALLQFFRRGGCC